MTDLSDFFSHAWQTIGRAIAEAGFRAGLREVPEVISKSVKRRCQAELKRLGILLRRLIFLMALQVELAPVKPRPGSNYFEKSEGEPEERKAVFSVLPAPAGETPDFLHGPITVPMRGPVPAAPLIARWQAMLDTLKHHKRRAKCLARTIQRWKAEGEARPYIAPIPKTYALPATLGIVSGGLTVQLIEALRGWPAADTS